MARRPAFRRPAITQADRRASAVVMIAYRRAQNLAPLSIETLMHSYGLKREEAEAMNG